MKHNLSDLIAQGEGSRIEFKQTISAAHRIARTLAAFANTAGGTLLIGVADNGRIVGVGSESHEMQLIERATDFKVEPGLTVSYELVVVDSKKVIIVDVPESEDKPHYAVNEYGQRTIYVRSKDKSVPTNKLILSQVPTNKELWDSPAVRSLLQFLRQNESITTGQLGQLVNISEGRAAKLLRQLTEEGLLVLVDTPRRGVSEGIKPVRYYLKVS